MSGHQHATPGNHGRWDSDKKPPERVEAGASRDGGVRNSDEQRAGEPRDRQKGGWNPDEDRSGRKPQRERDRDYDPDGDRVSSDR